MALGVNTSTAWGHTKALHIFLILWTTLIVHFYSTIRSINKQKTTTFQLLKYPHRMELQVSVTPPDSLFLIFTFQPCVVSSLPCH